MVVRQDPIPLAEHLGNPGELAVDQLQLKAWACQLGKTLSSHLHDELLASIAFDRDSSATELLSELAAELPNPRPTKVLQGSPAGDVLPYPRRYRPGHAISDGSHRLRGCALDQPEGILGQVGLGSVGQSHNVEVLYDRRVSD